MEPPTRALPYEDLAALHGVVAVVQSYLISGDLPPEVTQRLVRRLTDHGPLASGATPGSLNAALSDLGQRLHWAMGSDMEYPAPIPHRTTYHLTIPADSVFECMAALREAGAENIQDDGPPTSSGWEMRPTGPNGELERHSTDIPNGRAVTAAFPELAPDPAYHARIAQLTRLAESHGGRYEGASW